MVLCDFLSVDECAGSVREHKKMTRFIVRLMAADGPFLAQFALELHQRFDYIPVPCS
jgi:hypothetical protein